MFRIISYHRSSELGHINKDIKCLWYPSAGLNLVLFGQDRVGFPLRVVRSGRRDQRQRRLDRVEAKPIVWQQCRGVRGGWSEDKMKKTSKCLGTFRWPIMRNDGNAIRQPVSAKLQKIVQLKKIFKFCFIIFLYKYLY